MNEIDLKIREATNSDYSSICSLINNELGYPDISLEELSLRIEMMKKAGNYFTFVALLNNEIVGFIGIVQEIAFEISTYYFRIIALAVSKAYQNKGIGSSILKFIEMFASNKGVSYFTLSSGFQRIEAHAFYEHNGYKKRSYSFSKGTKHT